MIGIIGGTSLLYADLPELEKKIIHTPYGNSEVFCGDFAFLLRHHRNRMPHSINYRSHLAALAGIGVSAAYTLPDALFADVIEWDELRTGRRQEGIYYGVRAFIRKVTGALVIFITLQALGWSGYQTPPDGVTQFAQPASALTMIRLLASPFGAILLSGVIVFTALFPLTRERYARIQRLLEKRRGKMVE